MKWRVIYLAFASAIAAGMASTSACRSDTRADATGDGGSTTTGSGGSPDRVSTTTNAGPDVGIEDGCGDGVPEQDVYCFVEHEITDVIHPEHFVVADLDEDGQLELVFDVRGASPHQALVARWSDGLEIFAWQAPLQSFVARPRAAGPLELVGSPPRTFDLIDRAWLDGAALLRAQEPIVPVAEGIRVEASLGALDIDGDDQDELLGVAWDSGSWVVFPYALVGDEWIAVGEQVASTPHGYVHSASIDLDDDGVNELVVSEQFGNLHLFRANDGAVETAWTQQMEFPVSKIESGDLDGDGRLDLVLSMAGNRIALMRGREDGTLASASLLWLPGYVSPDDDLQLHPFKAVTVGDPDGDGRAELVAGLHPPGGPHSGPVDLAIIENPFSDPGVTIVRSAFPLGSALAAGDLDGDGLDDLIVDVRDEDGDVYHLRILISDP